jgi:molybdopterin-guanine dinucleotide biosynthesis protein MobB
VAATRIISIIGKKDAGKTSLVVALATELRRKLRVMTLKHGTHAADLDQRGKDTWRHWHEGKAERVLLEGPGSRVLFERTAHESDPITLARRYLEGADIVLAEGFSAYPLPKIEVFRTVCGDAPIYDPARPNADQWVAIITDHPTFRAPFPVFRFNDTSWLVALATLAWDRAQILSP